MSKADVAGIALYYPNTHKVGCKGSSCTFYVGYSFKENRNDTHGGFYVTKSAGTTGMKDFTVKYGNNRKAAPVF